MKVKLRDLPESVWVSEHASIVRVVHDMKCCIVYLVTHPSKIKIEIAFGGIIGLKVLDERDFREFWWKNMESFDQVEGALVTQVLSGGWRQHGEVLDSYIPTGLYGDVMEFFVSGDYECVNVLCTEQPRFKVLA